MKKVLFIAALTLTALCAWSKSKAEAVKWIEDPYSGYSNSDYLCATASAFSQDDADSKAIAAVTNSLTQTVQSEQYATQSMTSEGDKLSTYLLNFKTDSTVRELSGLEIKNRKSFKEKKQKKYYSRAVLDKQKASEQYEITLNSMTKQIEKLLEDAAKKADSLEKCACLLKAYDIAANSEYYITMISILTPKKQIALSYKNKAELESKIRAAFCNVTFAINSDGPAGPGLITAASEVVTNQGFTTVKNNGTYKASITANFEDMGFDPTNTYYFIRYDVTFKLTENASQKTLIEFNVKKRVGKLNKQDAQSAATRGAQTSIQEQFTSKLSSLLQ